MTHKTITTVFLTAIAGFWLFCEALFAQQGSYGHVDPAAVDTIFAEFTNDSPGCAVGVVDRGELIFAKGYGLANLDYGIPIEPDSRFMIASISKQFAAAALLMLEQEGKLDLDEDLRTVISGLPQIEHPITARQLIHHTSGLRDIFNLLSLADIGLDPTTTSEQALELIGRQQRLNFVPGSEYLYSNTGYFLMSVLVKNLSGMTLREYTNRHFFEPIGMNSTHFHDDTEMIVPDRAESYQPTSRGPGRFYRDNMDRVGARGLFTTIEDFARWDANFIENRSNLRNFTERMTQPGITLDGDTLDYASGLRISRYKTLETVGHGGNYMGFRTQYVRFSEEQLGLMVFCNMSNINPATYTYRLADLYLAGVFEEHLAEYTGWFRNEATGTQYDITVENGDLYLKRSAPVLSSGGDEKHRLSWNNDDAFTAQDLQITFRRNGQGGIDRLQMKGPRTAPLPFKKVKNEK